MKDDDKIFETLIRSIQTDIKPPRSFKEQLFQDIMHKSKMNYEPSYFAEKLFFDSPWKLTIPSSLIFSIIIKLAMGSSFNRVVGMIFGLGGF